MKQLLLSFVAKIRAVSKPDRGQSTIEYAVVLIGFFAVLGALGALVQAGWEGRYVALAQAYASHVLPQAIADILLY